jgi:Flp pilus assembly protein TadG
MVMVLFLAAATGDVVKWLQASARAQVAADAAALAAVQEMAEPTGQDPRAVASSFAVRNGASLLSCDCPVEGTSATVEVRTPVGGVLFLRSGTASARARAVADLGAG